MNSKKWRKIKLLKRLTAILLAVFVLAFLAVFFAFIPFRLLLPAYKLPARGEGELRLHFLDLDGGVTIVEFPSGSVLVVNAGGGTYDGDNTLFRYLRGIKPSKVSLLAENADARHVGGVPALLDTVRVDTVYLPAYGAETGSYQRFLSAIERKKVNAERISRYGVIADGSGAYAVCLSPYSEEAGSVYDSSVVLYLSYAGVNVVLAGDTSAARAGRLAEEYATFPQIFDSGEYRVRLDETKILYASCPNALSCTNREWLSLLAPELCVLSCNKNERPQSAVLENASLYCKKVCRTDELNTTIVTVKDGGYTITPHVIK